MSIWVGVAVLVVMVFVLMIWSLCRIAALSDRDMPRPRTDFRAWDCEASEWEWPR